MTNPSPIAPVTPVQKAATPLAKTGDGWAQQFVAQARRAIADAPPVAPMTYVREVGSTIGEFTAGGIAGSLLGATHAKWGLDTRTGPVDGWIAALGAFFGVALSAYFPEIASYARHIGSQAFTVLSFRTGYEIVKHESLPGAVASGVRRVSVPGKSPGVTKRDPIEVAAEALEI